MADTKISALTAAGAAALANEFAINEAGVSKKVTGTQLKTLVNTDPDFPAGSASAGTWPNLASGTLLTTPEAGAVERDGDVWYMTRAASQRGLIPLEHIILQDATYTLTSTTSAQKLFDASANGALQLETGWYLFECILGITSMSATIGNGQFQILGGGSATLGGVLYQVLGIDNVSAGVANQAGGWHVASNTGASMVTAAANTALGVSIRGSFEVTTAGTIIPSIALVTAAAAIISVGSYFRCHKVGAAGANRTVGNWS